ncbi:MAG: FtsW/RodA/SpoVE family cell cycle protein [Hyphomicrobium sp.]
MRISRADRSRFADWWFTADRALLGALMALLALGLVLSLAASPAVAMKKGLPPYYFVERHLMFAVLGMAIVMLTSLLPPQRVRRLALGILAASLVSLVWVHLFGAELNGARRWLSIAGHSLQPSEFAKPAFVVVSAWLLAQTSERPDMPAMPLAVTAYAGLVILLVAQPDVGQTLLVTLVWGALFFLSGQPMRAAGLLAALCGLGLLAAYHFLPHVQARFDKFLHPTPGDNSQIDRAMQSFAEGGFLGRGPGEGTIKIVLPDAHTDFIFAVVAEEYGALACLALLALFGFVVLRALTRAADEPDSGNRLAIAGLALLIGLQALIHMGVNVGLLPAKGMTLPFISAGGSSLLAASLLAGMLMSLTRRRADHERLKKPRLRSDIAAFDITGSAKP